MTTARGALFVPFLMKRVRAGPLAACLDSRMFPVRRKGELRGVGLGHARSGGFVLDLALAFCRTVDVFGMGLFSRGPAADGVYAHAYDERFAPGCTDLRCADAAELPPGRDRAFLAKEGARLCRPRRRCAADEGAGLPASEQARDFFYLSELRLHVLHALGAINWVWY